MLINSTYRCQFYKLLIKVLDFSSGIGEKQIFLTKIYGGDGNPLICGLPSSNVKFESSKSVCLISHACSVIETHGSVVYPVIEKQHKLFLKKNILNKTYKLYDYKVLYMYI